MRQRCQKCITEIMHVFGDISFGCWLCESEDTLIQDNAYGLSRHTEANLHFWANSDVIDIRFETFNKIVENRNTIISACSKS
jgi:hypothetical protein